MRVGVALGHGEEVLVVAIGSSSCGDISEGDFEESNSAPIIVNH